MATASCVRAYENLHLHSSPVFQKSHPVQTWLDSSLAQTNTCAGLFSTVFPPQPDYRPTVPLPRGSYILGGRGTWTSHQVWRQNLGQDPAKFTK